MTPFLTLLLTLIFIDECECSLTPASEDPGPLDTITGPEIESSAKNCLTMLKQEFPDGVWSVSSCSLKETDKSKILPFFLEGNIKDLPNDAALRLSHTVMFDRKTMRVFECVTDLRKGTLDSWKEMPHGLQPLTSLTEEGLDIPKMALSDARVLKRFAELKCNISNVVADAWFYVHNAERLEYQGRRIGQVFFYYKKFEGDNYFAHPVPLIVIVNIRTGVVIDLFNLPIQESFDAEDRTGEEIPMAEYQYDPEMRKTEEYRPKVKLMEMSQPEGVNFKVTGTFVEWQNWQFRIGFNAREGLLIYTVGFQDNFQKKFRPLFYKLHLSELFLNYGDPRPPFHRKIPFDIGHYGLGIRANQLNNITDCRGQTVFWDAFGVLGDGSVKKLKNAVCIFEEDDGNLIRKGNPQGDKYFSIRANRLGVKWVATSGNYDYEMVTWFYQNGNIEYDIRMQGIVNPNMLAKPQPGNSAGDLYKDHKHGTIVAPQINGMNHQHIFTYRIDPALDGAVNSVSEVNLELDPPREELGEKDYGNGWGPVSTPLRTVEEAQRMAKAEKGTTWSINVAGEKRNPISGTLLGYRVVPTYTPPSMIHKFAPMHSLVEFADYDMTVTLYNPEQMYAAGFYVNSSGITEWTKESAKESLVDKDLVLWHTFRGVHVTKTEEFPVMSYSPQRFKLVPFNFFLQAPAMDVEPIVSRPDESKGVCEVGCGLGKSK